jgi:hypothetical protein
MNELENYNFLLKKVKKHFKNIKNIKNIKSKKPDLKIILDFHDIYHQTCQSPNIKLRNTYFPKYISIIKKRIYYTLKTYMVNFNNEDELNEIMNLIDNYVKNISKHNLEILINHFNLLNN